MTAPLLTIENLSIGHHTINGEKMIAQNINIRMNREKIGIVGESGSGKTLTARAILGLIKKPLFYKADHLSLNGENLLSLNKKEMRKIRGKKISMVLQDPMYSLNPSMTVGKQIKESLDLHFKLPFKTAREKTLKMLCDVQIKNPRRVFKAYPHELSGGMAQRVMIAMMLIPSPDLLIADEPTSALDVTVQKSILKIIDEMVEKKNMGLIFISHDLKLVSSFCDRVYVMYKGHLLEHIAANNLKKATHPYTQGLWQCLPSITRKTEKLKVLTHDPAWLQ